MHSFPKAGGEMPKKYDVMDQSTEEKVQCPEDQQAPGYDNNPPHDWVRGKNEDACAMPHFDHSRPSSKMRR
ncbi:MAG: hypothetical protein WBC86_14550 [Pseudolabrys sp.]